MKTYLVSGAALLCSASTVMAAGIERTSQSVAPLFEEGRYGEFSLGAVSPSVSGDGSAAIGGGSSGDMSPNYFSFGAAYKADLNSTWSYAIILDQPFGADVEYPTGTGYFAQASTAEFNSVALTGIMQYNLPSNVSLYAGIRAQAVEAEAFVPFVSPTPGVTPPYEVNGDRDFGVGYLFGVAYERPDIALRVALTYNSEIDHELDTVESSALGADRESQTDVTTPQSLQLEFQSGVAEDTLVFGSIRWVDWSDFEIRPADYVVLTSGSPLVFYDEDYIAYNLGVGRRFNDTWSGAITLGYEPSQDFFTGNLGPTDGSASVGLAATYTRDNMKVTSGIRYVMIGDADTRAGAAAPAGIFRDNDAIAVGVRVGYNF